MLKRKPHSENLNDAERFAALRLFRTDNVGPILFKKLIGRYGNASKALEALPELSKRGGRAKPLTAPRESDIEREIKSLAKIKGRILTLFDADYPELLAQCDDAPPVISVIGNTELLQKNCIAMVGARNASLNGRKFAEKLARDLGQRGQVIVSGLARGIDTSAHIGSMSTGTIAVVAGGIDVIYPEENAALYNDIAERGLIIAESPFGQKPFAASFPRRNRIVSGLSKGVIVVEATLKSGSLITARLAGEQSRDVYAVPGHPLDPRASGPNALIRDGATLIRGADDVLENMINFVPNTLFDIAEKPEFSSFASDSDIPEDAQDIILSHLSFTPVTVDELIRTCHLSISVIQTILLELELAGRIKRLPGNRVSLLEG